MKYVKLTELADYLNGRAFKNSDWNSHGLPIIRIQNLTDATKPYNYYSGNFSENNLIKKGDLLISWSGTLDIYEWDKDDALLNQHIFKVVFNKSDVDKKYFFYAIKTILELMKRDTHGSTMKHITKKDFNKHSIPLPSIVDQKNISSHLDNIASIISLRKQSIQKLDELVQSVFYDMFGDKLMQNVNNLETLEDISIKITDGEHSTPKRSDAGIYLLSARNVKNGYIDFNAGVDYIPEDEYQRISKRCKPEMGDILISCSGTIGRVTSVKVSDRLSLVRSVALIKPNKEKVNSTYLEHLLLTPFVQSILIKKAHGGSQANLFTGQIKSVPVYVPSIKEQEKFSLIAERARNQKESYEQDLLILENLFQSYLYQSYSAETKQYAN